jgi:glycosyltransferase involved in cell wall biosynthesis
MKKTIFFLVNNLSFLKSHRIDVVLEAKKKDFKVIVGYGELGGASISFFLKRGVDCFPISLQRNSKNPFKELWSIFTIWQTFYKLNPDIVHLITIKPYLYGGIAARLAKIPCVVSSIAGLGILFNQNKLWNLCFQIILYPLFKFAFNHPNQKVIVQNQNDRKILMNWVNLDKKKILLLPGSGVDLSKYTKLKELNKIVTVCFASRLLRDKGVFDFACAAKLIQKRKIKAKFLLAGNLDPGNPTSLSFKDLNQIKNEKAVEVIGFQKDIPSLYAKSHIICLPSFYGEGLPKALIEAAAAGRAVVTTDTPGCRDAIIPNKTGLLVPAKDPQKLAKALISLITNHKERIIMGKAGRKLAEKKFSIHKIIKSHLKLYKELI